MFAESFDAATLWLAAARPPALRQAVELLQAGGLVAFPTDTVYGLGALVTNEASIGRIYAAKERPPEKAIPLLLASVDEARRVVGELPADAESLARAYWPGPLTLVVSCGDRVPPYITAGTQSVALRVPNHPVTLQLLALLGQPLAVTSANRSGFASPLTAQEVLDQLGGRIDAVVDGGRCPGGLSSTVLSLAVDPPEVLRVGPITPSELARLLEQDDIAVRIAV